MRFFDNFRTLKTPKQIMLAGRGLSVEHKDGASIILLTNPAQIYNFTTQRNIGFLGGQLSGVNSQRIEWHRVSDHNFDDADPWLIVRDATVREGDLVYADYDQVAISSLGFINAILAR